MCRCQMEDGQASTACQGDWQLTVSGLGNTCSLSVGQLELDQAGLYKCSLLDPIDIEPVTRSIEVLVRIMILFLMENYNNFSILFRSALNL